MRLVGGVCLSLAIAASSATHLLSAQQSVGTGRTMARIIYRDFSTLSSPFYDGLATPWYNPTWSAHSGETANADADLLHAEGVDIVSGRLSFTGSPADPVISGAVWGTVRNSTAYDTSSLHDTYNGNAPQTLYWEADILLTTSIYTANDVPYAPIFALYSRWSLYSNTMTLALAEDTATGDHEYYLEHLDGNGGWEDYGGLPIYTDTSEALVGTTANFRLEMTPASLVVPGDPQDYLVNLDGIIRLYINDVLVYENTAANFVPSYPEMDAYEQYEVGAVALGFSGFMGEYDYFDFGYVSGPPEGGGEVPTGTAPPSAPVPVGVVRIFGLLTYGGSPQDQLKVSETALSDPSSWYAGYGHPVLLSISSYTRELTDSVRAVEVRVELADTDRRFRTLAATDTLGGATWEHFLVSDTVRYALGEPHRRFCGRVHEHRALPGFRYELLVRDVLSEEMASLADAPRIPQKLGLLDLPGMSAEYEGLALQLAIGQLNDEAEVVGSPSVPQGVVPPLIVAPLINFQTAFGGINQDVIVTIVTHGALAPTGLWRIFYNTPTDPYTRIEVPPSVWGTLLWAPGQPGWSDTGLANDYADYPSDPVYTNRLTPLYVAADHANSQPFLDGRVLAAINLYGVTENADGTGLYLSDAPRIYQWLLSNFLYSNWKTGDYNDPPTFSNGITIINTDSVETTTARLRAFIDAGSPSTDSYPVGFLLGRGGQQQTLRHILGELCHGVAMEQGIDRHGRLMLDVEDVDAVATFSLSDLLDIENGEFEVWVDRSAYRNCLEYVHGYRYVPAVAPLPTPPEGETLPVRPIGTHADWTSGLQKLEHDDAIAANGGRRTPPMQLENYVVRAPDVAANWAARLLSRSVGPAPSYDGARMFRLTTSWQALDVELGDVIAIDHLEGLGATGYEGQRARVLKITDDLQAARITLEGRALFSAGSP